MRIVAIVQARVGSSRLPGKSLMPLSGRPLVAHALERVSCVCGVDEVLLATSLSERDAPLARLARDLGYRFWRGSEHDVLDRFAHAARYAEADLVVRVTGDCPFLAPEVCSRVVAVAREEPWWDYVSNDTTQSGYPDGTDCELFSRLTLERAAASAVHHMDREHVTPWMRRHLPVRIVHSTQDWGRDMKLSVDCAEDLALVRRVAGFLNHGGDFSLLATSAAYRAATKVPA